MVRELARYTLVEARAIRGKFVYGLSDVSGIFYIGKASNADRRFHKYADRVTNLHLKRRLTLAGDAVRVQIIVHNPADLTRAQADAILKYSTQLVNIVGNPYRTSRGVQIPMTAAPNQQPPCPICDRPMDQANSKNCRACTTNILSPKGSSKAELREMLANLRAA